MGLLDQVAGQVMGSLSGGGAQEGQSQLLELVQNLVQNEGGLNGLLSKLSEGGLADQAASWVGSGENAPVGADQLKDAVGGDLIGQLAGQLGMSQDQASEGLASYLPMVVDKLTPNGSVEGGDQLLQQGLSALGGLFGGK